MQKIAIFVVLLIFVYLVYRYMNMKSVDKKAPEKVADPDQPVTTTVQTVPIKDADVKDE